MSHYWDAWEREAIAAGVEVELASLGREVMRDHAQHGRDPSWEMGSADDGPVMLALCLGAPLYAEKRFVEEVTCQSSNLSPDEIEATTAAAVATRLGISEVDLDARLMEEWPKRDAIWREFAARRQG